MFDLAFEPHNVRHKTGEVGNRNVFAAADIDVLCVRPALQDEDQRIGAVIRTQKLPPGRAPQIVKEAVLETLAGCAFARAES